MRVGHEMKATQQRIQLYEGVVLYLAWLEKVKTAAYVSPANALVAAEQQLEWLKYIKDIP